MTLNSSALVFVFLRVEARPDERQAASRGWRFLGC